MTRTLLRLGLVGFLAMGSVVAAADGSRPHLELRHGVRQLVVNGQPFLILGGELHNSSSSSLAYIKPIWPRLADQKLNTVLAALSWELIEPEEGHFDFHLVDGLIQAARQHQLHLVFLWFGSWKNGESSYVPYWVKTNWQRFPLVQNAAGKHLNILSTLSAMTRDADARAFAAVMRHIRQVDGKVHTVLMMQIENEVGVLGDSRDRSAAANDAFAKPVPKALMNYLEQHKDTLAPELRAVWATNGFKTSGTWEEVFGPGRHDPSPVHGPTPEERETAWRNWYWPADEIFMAWNYARYVNQVAQAGKAEYDIPMYVNAWLQQRSCPWPGTYPSGGPLPQVADVWRATAPAIDFLSPDIYVPEFDETCERFTRNGNPLFIPEARTGHQAAVNALTALLKFNAIGFSPFGIDGFGSFRPPTQESGNSPGTDPLAETYAVLDYLAPDILRNQGKEHFVFLPPPEETNAPTQEVKLGGYTLNITFGDEASPRRGRGAFGRFGGRPAITSSFPARLLIGYGLGEYVFVGGGMNVRFTPDTPGPDTVHLASFDEAMLVDGHWVPGRRLNGDETGHNSRWPVMRDFGIYRVRVYRRD